MVNVKKIISLVFFSVALCNVGVAQEAKSTKPRFSNKGLKVSLASGSREMTKERNLQEGEGGALSLGYGFTDRFSLWLTLVGSEQARVGSEAKDVEFGGIVLNVEHKFQSNSNWQPYGKVGFGVYGLTEKHSDVSLVGAGINVGLGVDYFFSRHFGVGAEASFQKLDYSSRHDKSGSETVITDLSPNLNGDTGAFMLRLVIQ